MEKRELKMGDVVQLNEKTKNYKFVGALAMVDKAKPWGAQVGVNCLNGGHAYYRASWEEMDYIGEAPLKPFSPDETAK
jgi:hypothetical protein